MREYEGRNEQVTCEPGAKPATLIRRCQHLPAGKPVSRRSWALHARAGSSVMTWKEPELIEVRAEAQDQAEDPAAFVALTHQVRSAPAPTLKVAPWPGETPVASASDPVSLCR